MQFGIQFCLYLLACGLAKANILGDDPEPARFQPDDTVIDLGLEHTFELISLNEEKVTDAREQKADFRTCKPPSDFDIFASNCKGAFDCRKPGSGCSAGGSCDEATGMCRCSDYTGGCDCSLNCESHMAGCRKCSKEKCLLCAAPQYFVCPGDESCNPFCKNNCNGHKCDIDTGKCTCDAGWGGDDCTVACSKLDPHCTKCDIIKGCTKCDILKGFNPEPLCKVCKRHTCDCKGRGTCSCDGKCKCFRGFGGRSCKYECNMIHKGCTLCHQDNNVTNVTDGIWRCDKCDMNGFKPTPIQTNHSSNNSLVCEPTCPLGKSMKKGRCESCGTISKFKLGPSCATDLPNDLCLTRATSKAQEINQAGAAKVKVTLMPCAKEGSSDTMVKEAAANQMWLKRQVRVKSGSNSDSRQEEEFDTMTVPDEWLTAAGMLPKDDQFVKPEGEAYCLTSVMNSETGDATSDLSVQICEVTQELSQVRHLQLWTVKTSDCQDNEVSGLSRNINAFTLKKNNQTIGPKDGLAAENVAVTLQKVNNGTDYAKASKQKWTSFGIQAISKCT